MTVCHWCHKQDVDLLDHECVTLYDADFWAVCDRCGKRTYRRCPPRPDPIPPTTLLHYRCGQCGAGVVGRMFPEMDG